ncbi:MAG: penicillin-binding protein activator [Betaproteobacteria bacterium]|nr:penicillin-binding protein activator [Betaproteobacteria bacterium]
MLIRAVWLSCGLFWACGAPAFSAEEKKPASTPPPASVPRASPGTPASTPPAPAVPDAKRESQKAPVESKEPAKADAPKDAQKPASPATLAPHIALILPTGSKAFGKVAEAVRSGFAAAAMAEGKDAAAYRVYATDDDTTALAKEVRRATNEGAVLIAGGLTRDGANMLARETGVLPALALNTPATADAELPELYFHVSLSLDSEARSLARRVSEDGLKRIAVLSTGTPLARRVQESFEREWLRRGGEIAMRVMVSGELAAGERLFATFENAQADSALLLADRKAARSARPFLPQGMPVYTTTYTIDPRADAVENLDLDGMRFLEMPWFVDALHPAVMTYPKPSEPLPIELERLYALGIDAWRLAHAMIKAENLTRFAPLDGVTGKITLDGKQFVRALTSAELRDGRVVVRTGANE